MAKGKGKGKKDARDGNTARRLQALERASHMQHLTEEGFNFLSETTDPFGWFAKGGEAQKVPDASGARTVAGVVACRTAVAVPAGRTVVMITLTPNSEEDQLLEVAFATTTAADMDNASSVAPAEWTTMKAQMASAKSYRITGAGLRCNVGGPAGTQNGFFRGAEGVVPFYDTSAFRTPAEVEAGFTRHGIDYTAEQGITVRKIYEEDFNALDTHASATTLNRERMFIEGIGLTATAVLQIEAVLFVEYRPIISSVVRPTPSPVDFHYDIIKAIAYNESELDAEGHTFKSIIQRLGDYVAAGAKGAIPGALGGNAPGAAAGALTAVGPLLLDDLLRLIPPKWR